MVKKEVKKTEPSKGIRIFAWGFLGVLLLAVVASVIGTLGLKEIIHNNAESPAEPTDYIAEGAVYAYYKTMYDECEPYFIPDTEEDPSEDEDEDFDDEEFWDEDEDLEDEYLDEAESEEEQQSQDQKGMWFSKCPIRNEAYIDEEGDRIISGGSTVFYNGVIIDDEGEFYDAFYSNDYHYDDLFFDNNFLIAVSADADACGLTASVHLSKVENGIGTVENIETFSCTDTCYFRSKTKGRPIYLIPVSRRYKINSVDVRRSSRRAEECYPMEDKPVIYLYPTSTTDVDVKLGAPEKVTVSYPKYSDMWRVTARPDGTLIDRTTRRELYALYYEAKNTTTSGMHDQGFVVRGADTISFLETKLAQLGLTEREAEEFIVYWLPQMEKNPYNYIYFGTATEISDMMPLEVSPAPDTLIRVYMEFKALDAPIEIEEQQLPATPIRKGFTAVEWGGTAL